MLNMHGRRIRQVLRSLVATKGQHYFGHLALRLPIIVDPSRENIGTDGTHLFYNPEWVLEHTSDEIKLRLADCVLGCSLKHHTRRGERDYKKWQHAHAQVTLPLLRGCGLTDDPGGLDMSIERAYDQIPDLPGDGGGGDGQQQQQGGGGAAPQAGQQPPQPQDGQGGGDGQGEQPDAPQGQQGGGQGQGQPDGQQEQPSYAAPGSGEMMDAPMPEDPTQREAARKEQEQEWDQAGKQAVAMAKAEGRSPDAIADILERAHRGEQPWEDILRDFMVANAKHDYTWTKPNRRFVGMGLHLPSLHSQDGMPPMGFIQDVSGSMDKEARDLCWGEVFHAAQEVEPEKIVVLACNTHVTSADEFDMHDLPEELETRVGGGTRYAPAFAYMSEHFDKLACVVYLTDGHCTDFGPEPDYPVMWALEPQHNANFRPPFGEVIKLEVER